jgi:hypothetical protein
MVKRPISRLRIGMPPFYLPELYRTHGAIRRLV